MKIKSIKKIELEEVLVGSMHWNETYYRGIDGCWYAIHRHNVIGEMKNKLESLYQQHKKNEKNKV